MVAGGMATLHYHVGPRASFCHLVLVLLVITILPWYSYNCAYTRMSDDVNSGRVQREVNQETREYISRLNYGVIANKLQNVDIVEDYWSHIFHVQLPVQLSRSKLTRVGFRLNRDRSCNMTCLSIQASIMQRTTS